MKKQVSYRIRGRIDDSTVPAILAACAAVPGVRRVYTAPTEELDTDLYLLMMGEPTEAQEKRLSDALAALGVALILDTCVVIDYDEPKPLPKKSKTVSLGSAIAAMVLVAVIAVLLTFALSANYLRREKAPVPEKEATVFDQMALLDRLFRDLTVNEMDEDFETQLLKAYVAATGDQYAEYFTAEELAELLDDQKGEMYGIGIQIMDSICTVGGVPYQAFVVTNVYKDSPAEAAGVRSGDAIMYVGIGDEKVLINQIGYTEALDRMSGEEGTTCTFTVFRFGHSEEVYEEVEISAVRKKMQTRSVNGRVYGPDSTVGVIKITGFENTTAAQLSETIDDLKKAGCTSFVLDLRGNPGGLLTAVEDVMTFFLNEKDIMVSMKDSKGKQTVDQLLVAEDGTVLVGSRTLTRADIGKYRDLDFTVLVNRHSASASELFTANMQHYGLAEIVGEKTFGKGSVQSTFSLKAYGYDGALKLTMAHYFPASGVGYHGVGILPDVPVELDESVKNINLNLLTDAQDNQLAAAVQALSPVA